MNFLLHLFETGDWFSILCIALAIALVIFGAVMLAWQHRQLRRIDEESRIRRGEERGYYHGRRDERHEQCREAAALPMIIERGLDGRQRRLDR